MVHSNAFRWLGRTLVSLAAIVLVLLAGKALLAEGAGLAQIQTQLPALRKDLAALKAFSARRSNEVLGSVRAVQAKSTGELERHRRELALEKSAREAERAQLHDSVASKVPGTSAFFQVRRLAIEIELLRQVIEHVDQVASLARGTADALQRAKDDLQMNRHLQWRLSREHPVAWQVPGTAPYKEMKQLEAQEASLRRTIEQRERAAKQLQPGKHLPAFKLDAQRLQLPLREVQERIDKAEEYISRSWLMRVLRPVQEVLPTALLVLAGAMLSGLVGRTVIYYLLAPLAARRPGQPLFPGSSGRIRAVGRRGAPVHDLPSAVSLPLVLEPGSTLVIRSRFLQAQPQGSDVCTRWLLDRRMPLSSWVTGMVNLTSITTGAGGPVTVSSPDDPLAEFTLIDVPAGAALVLRPRSLVGVVESGQTRVRITRHWRLTSLSTWLTLHLRQVVFHGPTKLIVQGCRGVRVEPVSVGRSVAPAATLGYSANLSHALVRTDTFAAYLFGHRPLFLERWNGAEGVCVYAETANPQVQPASAGRGVSGLGDAVLKVVGL